MKKVKTRILKTLSPMGKNMEIFKVQMLKQCGWFCNYKWMDVYYSLDPEDLTLVTDNEFYDYPDCANLRNTVDSYQKAKRIENRIHVAQSDDQEWDVTSHRTSSFCREVWEAPKDRMPPS